MTIWHGTVNDGEITTQETILWDRKRDGGFPGMFSSFCFIIYYCMHVRLCIRLYVVDHSFLSSEVKALKSLVRNVIAPDRDLGHTDRALEKQQDEQKEVKEEEKSEGKAGCEDCQ